MNVRYIHTFTVTVEGSDSFADSETLKKATEYGERDASLVQLMVKRGIAEPVPVRASVVTKTVIVHEPDQREF